MVASLAKIADDRADRCRSNVAIHARIDLHRRRERATAQARDLRERELAGRVGVVAIGNLQQPPERVEHRGRTLDVTRRTRTHADGVSAHRPQAKMGIERRHRRQARGGNARPLGKKIHRLDGNVSQFILNRLQQQHRLRRVVAEALDHGLQRGAVIL